MRKVFSHLKLSITACCSSSAFFLNDNKTCNNRYSPIIIIGGGWSGIGTAASLKANNVNDYLILEKGNCFGYFWSKLYDNIKMNTFKHRLWHSPISIEENGQIPAYRDKNNVLHYLLSYSKYYDIDKNVQFNTNVTNIKYNEENKQWIIEIDNDFNKKINCDYLVIATSINNSPYIPNIKNMEKFNGKMIHSFEYKNAKQFDDNDDEKNKKYLIIGCGNSSIEIAGEIKSYNKDLNDVDILIRSGRHFTKETTKYRFESILDKICSPSPFSEESLINDNLISCNDLKFHLDIIQFDKFTDFMIFKDMTKFGIPKPKLSPTADHYYNKKLTIVDRNTIPLIKKKEINIINNKGIKQFTENGDIQFDDGTIKKYDIIIFGTGYRHNLNNLFETELWNKLSTKKFNYPRNELIEILKNKGIKESIIPNERSYKWPLLNGRCRSKIYDNLYFAGFDQGYLGGLTIGLYSWAIGEEIAIKLNKLHIDKCTIPWIKTETMCDFN